jgi:hypothetical protein
MRTFRGNGKRFEGLARMNDGGYASALTSESNTGVPNVDRFLSGKMTKEEAYEHH